MIRPVYLFAALAWMVLPAPAAFAATQPEGPPQESLSDAWWTGPLLAPNAATLPQGHFYIEPYLYDEMPYAQYDGRGHTHPTAYGNTFGSLTYMNYGLTDRLTVGAIPTFGYDRPADAPASSRVGVGDLTLQAQYRITPLDPRSRIPIASVNVQQSLPIGRYDRLQRASDGFGSGVETTIVSAYFMSYFWLPNGRIMRTRLDLSYAMPGETSLVDRSVYGTPVGFRGLAHPGQYAYGDLAFEYSMTRNWVLACDFWFEEYGGGRVTGAVLQPNDQLTGFQSASATGRELYVAPALEYNWSGRLGVIFGVRVVSVGRNETGTVTPVVALSYFD